MSKTDWKFRYRAATLLLLTMPSAITVGLAIDPRLVAQESSTQVPQTQESDTQESKDQEQSALVEGLLDLLGEAPARTSAGEASNPSSPRLDDSERGNTALGDGSSAPLESVRRNMLEAARLLGKGRADTQTQQVQSDITRGLDVLIAELEKSNASRSSSQNSRQQQQEQSSSSQAGQQPDSGRPSQAQKASEPRQGETQSSQSAQDAPAPERATGEVVLDLADPKMLQENVWGQLPEQVRKQMQSRMVEKFLPSYRAQIEAYFQALLDSRPP